MHFSRSYSIIFKTLSYSHPSSKPIKFEIQYIQRLNQSLLQASNRLSLESNWCKGNKRKFASIGAHHRISSGLSQGESLINIYPGGIIANTGLSKRSSLRKSGIDPALMHSWIGSSGRLSSVLVQFSRDSKRIGTSR